MSDKPTPPPPQAPVPEEARKIIEEMADGYLQGQSRIGRAGRRLKKLLDL